MKVFASTKETFLTAFLSALFTLVLLFLISYFFNHSWNLFSAAGSKQLFTVEGTSSITQKPDAANVSFTVTKTAASLQDAQNQANTAVNTMVSDLQKLGINKKDIKTSNYSSYPKYDNNTSGVPVGMMMPVRGGQTITGYTVSENVDVTLSDIAKANNVIDAVTKDGVENVSGPNLTFSPTTQQALVDKARLQAVTQAKRKAQSLADAAGIRLGRVVNIQESNTNPVPIEPMMLQSGIKGTTGGTPTQINPGENTITETVTLSYETW